MRCFPFSFVIFKSFSYCTLCLICCCFSLLYLMCLFFDKLAIRFGEIIGVKSMEPELIGQRLATVTLPLAIVSVQMNIGVWSFSRPRAGNLHVFWSLKDLFRCLKFEIYDGQPSKWIGMLWRGRKKTLDEMIGPGDEHMTFSACTQQRKTESNC